MKNLRDFIVQLKLYNYCRV